MEFGNLYRFSVHAVIIDGEGKVLLVKQTYADKRWGLPGGGVELGETIHKAILRECMEELGVNIMVHALTGFYYHKSFNSQVGIFKCSLPEKADITLSSEHSEYKWVDMSELSEVQKTRVMDCINYDGKVVSRAF